MSAQVTYIPEENERAYYQGLFKAADVQGQGQIGGAEAVKFFTLSKLPIDTLKNIWTVADRPPSNSLDPPKFAVAVRLIQCMQNGKRGQGANLATPAGVTMRPAMFDGVSGVSVPFPEDGAPPAPDAPPSQPQAAPGGPPADSHMSMMAQQHQQASTAVPPQDTYGMTQQAVQRVEPVFKEYAKEDGFVYGAEAVALFGKSGMPQAQLASIWKMVDTPVDNRLDKLEFAMALHLIVCVMKKNMPMPSGLPPSLKQLKQQSQPQAAAAAPPSHTPAPAAQTQENAAASAPALGTAQRGMSISDAFGGLDPEPAPTRILTPETVLEGHLMEEARNISEQEEHIAKRKRSLLTALEKVRPALRAKIEAFVFVDSKEEAPVSKHQECVVCCDNKATQAVVPCGHHCLCDACAQTLRCSSDPAARACPLCRAGIESTLRIYTASPS